MKIRDVIKKSINIMRNNKKKLIYLLCSFLGWILLIILGIKMLDVFIFLGIFTSLGAIVGFFYLNIYIRVSLGEFYFGLTDKKLPESSINSFEEK